MSDELDLAWNDDRLLEELAKYLGDDHYTDDAMIVLRLVRDSLQARIAELEAQPASNAAGVERWEPAENGQYQWSEQEAYRVNGNELEVYVMPRVNGRLRAIESVAVNLPPDIRLCRLTASPQPPAEVVKLERGLSEVTAVGDAIIDWQKAVIGGLRDQIAKVQQPPAMALTDEHVQTIRSALALLKRDDDFYLAGRHEDEINAAIVAFDAAITASPQAIYIGLAVEPNTAEYDQVWAKEYPDGRTELLSGDGKILASPQPPAMALDMPDAPGWWAFEGHHHFYNGLVGELIQTVVQVIDTSDGLYGFGERIGGKIDIHLVGKWTRVYMPWEQQARV